MAECRQLERALTLEWLEKNSKVTVKPYAGS